MTPKELKELQERARARAEENARKYHSAEKIRPATHGEKMSVLAKIRDREK